MSDVLYFAYGSNLLRERLLARCPGLDSAGKATFAGHRLTFDKLSNDGSGKCAFEPVESGDVVGVLWNVPRDELELLDRVEGVGKGYERCQVLVKQQKREYEALTYRATHRQPGLQPFDWYLALVLAGATQQSFPAGYIDGLRTTPFQRDSNLERKGRRQAMCALEDANMLSVLDALNANVAEVSLRNGFKD